VIQTLQDGRIAASLRHDCGRMMPADVIKSPQNPVFSAHNYQRFSREVARDKVSRLPQLIGSGNELPCSAEHTQALQFRDPRVRVPRRGNGRRRLQGSAIVITGENLLEGCSHGSEVSDDHL